MKMHQRQHKNENFDIKKLESEWVDVLATIFLLGLELNLDIEKVIKDKMEVIKNRLEID